MIAEIIATIEVIEQVAEHTDLVIGLAQKLRAFISGDKATNVEAMRGLAAGMAAARANAVQEYKRREKTPVMVPRQ